MTSEIYRANLKFSWDLFKKLVEKNRDDNVFFSPISIMAALSMILAGARNNSQVQMKQTMHLTEVDVNKLHSSMGELLNSLNKTTDGVILNLANKLYFDRDLQLLAEFVNLLQKEYASEISQVDFKSQFESTRLLINNWVEEQTQRKIQHLLPEASLNSLTRAVLVNAIYFKGVWQKQFNIQNTYDGEFFPITDDPNPFTVKFMFMEDQFNYGHDDELQCSVLEIPFKGHSASMIVVLPDEMNGLTKLEAQLDADRLDALLRETHMIKVKVHLPKFKIDSSYNLKEVLPQLGMRDIFLENKADLSGLVATEDLFVSKVVHKAFIEVTEEGAEAAAATAVVMIFRCAFVPTVTFKADHPFLVFLQAATSQIMFMGVVNKP